MSRPLVVCLLPVRNGAADLPDWFDSVGKLCDAVVALDDGSTDCTRTLLEASDLVRIVLRNPVRPSCAGWNDGENRNRLLEAAADLDPQWIVSIDADERLDDEDAWALRRFLANDGLPGVAYGLQHFRIWGENLHPARFQWVYRVFAFERGQSFPHRRLHFNPVPCSIGQDRWVRTTIRLRHLSAANEPRRLARLHKYRDADPEGEYPTDFGGLACVPEGDLTQWQPRPAGLSALSPGYRRARRSS